MYSYEGLFQNNSWNLIANEWQMISTEWQDPFIGGERLISTDRAWVEGVNGVDITMYTSTNQTGTYTTYNN
jgi:hypothetical protein